MTNNLVFIDENGRKYTHELVWTRKADGTLGCDFEVCYLRDDSEDGEMDMRVFYDEDIARLLAWFEYEEIFDGSIFEFWMCNDCGDFMDDDEDGERHIYEGNCICQTCFDDDYTTCYMCDSILHMDDAHSVDDGCVCDRCFDDNYSRCMDCSEWFENRVMVSDDGDNSLCRNCYDRNWTRCNDCGNFIHCDDIYCDDNDGCYCESCWENNGHDGQADSNGIHKYGYRPDLDFKGDGLLYFGTEMEIDEGNVSQFDMSKLSDNFYCCHDGSLGWKGFEIISHPMTYEWIMEHRPYEHVCELAKAAGYKSHDTKTCGFHVHMSRRAFGDCYDSKTEERITSFIYFFEKFWTEVVKFSRRKHDFTIYDEEINAIDGYVKRMCDVSDTMPITHKVVDEAKAEKHFDRYTCVNLVNSETIEVRIFKGTLNVNTIIASIQLVRLFHSLSVFDVDTIEHMTWEQIKEYAVQDYPELLKYLAERGL
jgi:uncharacterized protein (UPF0212 family)